MITIIKKIDLNTVTKKIKLNTFEPFIGEDFFVIFTEDQLSVIEDFINEEYPNGIDEDELDDLFGLEYDFLSLMFGFDTIEELDDYNMTHDIL